MLYNITQEDIPLIYLCFFFRYLVCFFAKVAENSEINKMSSSNIAIVLAPNLIWSEADEGGYVVYFEFARPSVTFRS